MADDHVTPRELYDRLERMEEKVGYRLNAIEAKVGDRLTLIEAAQDDEAKARTDHEKDDERRFGRLEKLIALLVAAVVSPKLGGPDVSHVVSTVVQTWLG